GGYGRLPARGRTVLDVAPRGLLDRDGAWPPWRRGSRIDSGLRTMGGQICGAAGPVATRPVMAIVPSRPSAQGIFREDLVTGNVGGRLASGARPHTDVVTPGGNGPPLTRPGRARRPPAPPGRAHSRSA